MSSLYGDMNPEPGLNYLAVEISWGSQWINLNDRQRYVIDADTTRDGVSKTWRKYTAESPVLGGNYLVHAVPDMVNETIGVWVHGESQTDLADNFWTLNDMFEQFDYRIRWTTDEYREIWRCQLAEATTSRGQIWTHSQMAKAQFSVPRYPVITRERVN